MVKLSTPVFAAEAVMTPPEEQMRDRMREAGLVPPAVLIFDGKIHRFRSDPKKVGRAGWYRGYLDGVPAGAFGCHRNGIVQKFRAVGTRPMTASEEADYERWLAATLAEREAEEERRHEVAADVVEAIWDGAEDAPDDHPYLVRKGVKAHGTKVTGDGRLICPLYDVDGDMTSLQYIAVTPSGSIKEYHRDGLQRESFWVLGALNNEGPVYICEGFATAATVFEETGRPTVVAYSAGKLEVVTGHIKALLGDVKNICIVADNDRGHQGRDHAVQARAQHGCRYVIPEILGDANDYRAAGRDLKALLDPQAASPAKSWLVKFGDFIAQPAPIPWIVKGWLQGNALMMVHGPSGHGKTFTVLDWCCRIASGMPEWRGHKVKAGDVVYLAGEGHHGLRARCAAWAHHHNASASRMLISASGCDLDDEKGLQHATDAIAAWESRPSLIVVDTLHRFMSKDENQAKDVRGMLESCAQLMERFGCSVLLVHHTGNSEDAQTRGRGSSSWRGALDLEISVSKKAMTTEEITIAQMKSKDAELAAPIYARLQRVEIPGWFDEEGQPVTSAVAVEGDAPVVHTKGDDKLEGARQTFEAAWRASGQEARAGAPYVSRSALYEFLLSEAGGQKTEGTAAQYCKESHKTGTVGRLSAAGYLQQTEHGWTVSDDTAISALMMSLRGAVTP